jgi:tRNA dimethylallyltransferase
MGIGKLAAGMARPDVIVVTGPTASGKSALALALAKQRQGTVINADAMQTYDAFPILTAQPTSAERATIPHRLYGVLPLSEAMSAARWSALARVEIERCRDERRLPILCGGSGLYLRALMQGLASMPAIPAGVRAAANDDWQRLGANAFRARLGERDPAIVAKLKAGDRQRHVRAWEVLVATGTPLSQWQSRQAQAAPWRFFTVLLVPERAWLRERIAARFASMMSSGVLAEVRAVFDTKPDPLWPGLKAHGAPELFQHLRGELGLGEACQIAIDHTRQYAKRQMTWFRHQLTPDLVIEVGPSQSLGSLEKYLDKIGV